MRHKDTCKFSQKNQNSKNTIPDISCFRLSLTDFFRESHPELLADETFISARKKVAAEKPFKTTAIILKSTGKCRSFSGFTFRHA
jgi:hypothetical protein